MEEEVNRDQGDPDPVRPEEMTKNPGGQPAKSRGPHPQLISRSEEKKRQWQTWRRRGREQSQGWS